MSGREWLGRRSRKTVNGGAGVDVLAAVNAFNITLQQTSKTTTVTPRTESAEGVLLANTAVQNGSYRDIDTTNFMAQVITPSAFPSVPANAVSWNITKIAFYGRQNGQRVGYALRPGSRDRRPLRQSDRQCVWADVNRRIGSDKF